MDYKNLKKLSEKFVKQSDTVVLTNPIEKYNYFIENYSVKYNKVDSIDLNSIPFQSFYTICFLIQNKIINYFIIFVVIPGVLLVGREYLNQRGNLYNYIMNIYYISLNLTFLSVLAIYIYAKRIYKNNFKLVENPFRRMVFHPDICRNILIKHIELNIQELVKINLPENRIRELMRNEQNGKVNFMVYSHDFVFCYSDIINTSNILKHTFWFSSSLVNYILLIFVFAISNFK